MREATRRNLKLTMQNLEGALSAEPMNLPRVALVGGLLCGWVDAALLEEPEILTPVLYAIQHKPTGGFIPAGKDRGSKTALEPSLAEPPRLFTKEGTAKAWLTTWLKGRQKQVFVQHMDSFEPEPEIQTTPTHHRKREDMEVVPVRLVLATRDQK